MGVRRTAWVDAVTFLIFLIFLGRSQGAEAVGAMAMGWATAIPWFYLTDMPRGNSPDRGPFLAGKGLSLGVGLLLVTVPLALTGLPPVLWGLVGFGFLLKGMDSLEHLMETPHPWLSWIRGPVIFGVFWGSNSLTGNISLGLLGGGLSAWAFMGGETWRRMDWVRLKAHWRQFLGQSAGWGLPLLLASLLLLLPFFGLILSYGWGDAGYLAICGFWIFLGNWLMDRTRPQWVKVLRDELEKGNNSETFLRKVLWSLGQGSLMAAALVLLSVFYGASLLHWVLGENFARYEDILIWMTAAGGLFWLNAQLCMARGAIQLPGETTGFLLFWVGLQCLITVFFIPQLGIAGAAWSLFFIGVLMIPVQMILLERGLRKKFSKKG